MSWKPHEKALIDGVCTVEAYYDVQMGEVINADCVDFNAPTDQHWKEVRVITHGFERDMSAADFDKDYIPLWREVDPS